MAACTWTTLTGAKSASGSIKRWVNNDSLDAEEIIAEAEDYLGTMLRTKLMQERVTIALADGDSTIDLDVSAPGFLDPINLFIDGYGELDNIDESDLDQRRFADSDGALVEDVPSKYAIIGTTLYFNTEVDQDYSLQLIYYKRPEALSAANLTNLYVEKYRTLFKWVAMGLAYIFLKDEQRATGLLQAANGRIDAINAEDDLKRRGQVYGYEVS
jgi:hypothetical protein